MSRHDTDGSIPLPEVAAWAGLGDRCPAVTTDGHSSDLLTALNDDDGYTFDQLADLIEAQWEAM